MPVAPAALRANLPSYPREWTPARRWTIVILLSVFCLISPMSSSMVVPALDNISQDLQITSSFTKQLVLSIFVLTYGIVPLVIGPLSEQYGRVPVLQAGNCVYIAFNTACSAARTPAQMLTFRAVSGIGAGAPLAVGAAVIGDMFHPDKRGKAIAIYNMAPILGPSLGALMGAAITEFISWPWIFYIVSCVDALILVVSIFLLQETYLPLLEERQRCNDFGSATAALTPKGRLVSFAKSQARTVGRSLKMLLTQPVIQLLAIYVAYLYGVMYLVLSTYPTLWSARYHQSVLTGGLNYLSLGLGYVIGSLICTFTADKIYRSLKSHKNNAGIPEFRLPLAILSAFLVPAGLIIYAWSAQYRTYWLVPDLGCTIFSMGVIIGMQCSTGYIIDAYPRYSASAYGAVLLLRGLAGFGVPLGGPDMYDQLGYGWGNSLLACVAVVIGIAAPLALWFFGQRLRKHSDISSDLAEA